MKLSNSSNILHDHPIWYVLFVIFTLSRIPFSFSEIKNTHIVDDPRAMIFFETFGFSEHGRVGIFVKDVSWNSYAQNPTSNPSLMGFFLARTSSLARIIINESEFGNLDHACSLSSKYVTPLFKFDNLSSSASYNGSLSIDDPGEYSLVFSNCQPKFQVTMYVHTEMYNIQNGIRSYLSMGEMILPKFYFGLFLLYTSFFALWIYECIKQRPSVDKIHVIMGALLCVKALKLICASEDTMYVAKTGTPHGWDVAFYIFGFFKGIMLFTVIILIGTGWSFLKPYLQEREKKVLMVVIPLQVLENIAYIITSETGPAMEDWMAWTQLFLMIDIICCCAVFFPIIWSIKSLREASKTDGKALRNLEKLNLFKQFYVVVIAYLYFTRVVVSSIGALLDYRYLWVTNALAEGGSFAFYVFVFYNFRPIERNPYLVIDEEEENVAGQLLEEDDSFEL